MNFKYLKFFLIFLLIFNFFVIGNLCYAGQLKEGLTSAAKQGGLVAEGYDESKGLVYIIGAGISIIWKAVPVLYLILALFAGILWITSSGDPNVVKRAKNILIHATVAFAAIMLAAMLVSEILSVIGAATDTGGGGDAGTGGA